MYFRVFPLPLSARLLAQSAELALRAYEALPPRGERSVADARAFILKHASIPGAIMCAGLEGEQMQGIAIGVVETRTWPALFHLSLLCVEPARQRQRFGADLLEFALRQSHARGADLAVMNFPLSEAAHGFLLARGFRPDDHNVQLRLPLSESAADLSMALSLHRERTIEPHNR